MIADADIAIVGAGVMGLAIAYNLATARGGRRIVVVDGTTWRGARRGATAAACASSGRPR